MNQGIMNKGLSVIKTEYHAYRFQYLILFGISLCSFGLFAYNYINTTTDAYFLSNRLSQFSVCYLIILLSAKLIEEEHPLISYYLAMCSRFYFILAFAMMMTIQFIYTPFPAFDKYVVKLDNYLGFYSPAVITWAKSHGLYDFLFAIYRSLIPQVVLTPVLLAIFKKNEEYRELLACYIFSLALILLIYFLIPVTTPASMYPHDHFIQSQIYVPKAFQELQVYGRIPTEMYAFIGLPSPHVIWVFFASYSLRKIAVVNIIALLICLGSILSTLTTGWHYLTDIIASGCVILITLAVVHYAERRRDKSAINDCQP